MKDNKGITIIALVVTIIVLLILAGVTIVNFTGGEGIMEEAKNKKDDTVISKEKDILSNAVITITNNKSQEITENTLRDTLGSSNVDIVKSGGVYRVTFKSSNNLYKINEDGDFFYWEDMEPTDMFGKIDGTTLYLRSTSKTGYIKSTSWQKVSVEKIVFEEPIAPTTCSSMFLNCKSLKEIENIEYLHTENSTSMYAMFYQCGIESLNLKYFDTSKVENMQEMFFGCSNLEEINLNNWNTCSNKTMQNMFRGCNKLKKLDLSNFDTSNVTNMARTFQDCFVLTDLNVSSFNTKIVTNMVCLFANCYQLKKLDLSSFDTSSVISMECMFYNDTNLRVLDLSSFDTSSVANMNSMIRSCSNLTTIYVSDKFVTTNASTSNMFSYSSLIKGGAGTPYSSSFVNGTYARIDNPPDAKGYFTQK